MPMATRTPQTPTDTSWLRWLNSRAVLAALRAGGGVGRREIARRTGLSVATVCRVVKELADEGLIAEVGVVSVDGARRKTTLLDINPDGGWVAALDLGGSRVRAAAMDLAGRIRESLELPLGSTRGEESAIPAIRCALESILAGSGEPKGAPLAIGVSSSGIVDPEAGVVKLSFNLDLRDFPIAEVVREVCDVPAVVRGDVAASTLAEAKLGKGRESSDFAYVTVGAGVGAGLVFGGKVRELPCEAEFGLMVVAPEGDPERFGGRGYLESVASGRGIAAAARRELEAGAKSALSELALRGGPIAAKTVADAARHGDELAAAVLARAAHYLGMGIVNLAHTLGLALFVIGGGVSMSGDAFWNPLREAVAKYEYWPGRIRLEPSPLAGDAAILGAGMLALDRAFAPMK